MTYHPPFDVIAGAALTPADPGSSDDLIDYGKVAEPQTSPPPPSPLPVPGPINPGSDEVYARYYEHDELGGWSISHGRNRGYADLTQVNSGVFGWGDDWNDVFRL